MNMRRSLRFGVIAAFLLSCAALVAPAASAHPANVAVFCESGSASFYCEVSYTDAHDPTTIQWYRNGNHVPAFDNRFSISQSCNVGDFYTLLAVVTDAHGSAQASYPFTCRRHWQ